VADPAGSETLAPTVGTMARANGALTYVSSELHPAFSPLSTLTPTTQPKRRRRKTCKKFDWLEAKLSDGRAYLTGANFTIADAYAYVVTNWSNFTDFLTLIRDGGRWQIISKVFHWEERTN
jgi:glutathione S-transferase